MHQTSRVECPHYWVFVMVHDKKTVLRKWWWECNPPASSLPGTHQWLDLYPFLYRTQNHLVYIIYKIFKTSSHLKISYFIFENYGAKECWVLGLTGLPWDTQWAWWWQRGVGGAHWWRGGGGGGGGCWEATKYRIVIICGRCLLIHSVPQTRPGSGWDRSGQAAGRV